MPIIGLDEELNLVDDYRQAAMGINVFALNIEGDHEGGFASRVIKELEIEKFEKVGPGKLGEAIRITGPRGEDWWGIRCYSLGYEGWDNAKAALLIGLDVIKAHYGFDGDSEWYSITPMSVQLPGGDKVGKLQGSDPMDCLAAFAEHGHTKSVIHNG